MKLKINYDLMTKVVEANNGFSLKRAAKKVMLYTYISSALGMIDNIVLQKPIEEYVVEVISYVAWHSVFTTLFGMGISKLVKIISLDDLRRLSAELKNLNVNTSQEQLLQSYKYKTEYKLNTDEGIIPKVEQKKYIMVPVYENGEEKEVSLLQEHTIGSNEYVLSIGTPKKVYKLAYGFAN